MNKFIVQVNGPAYGSTTSFRALKFCQAAASAGHQVVKVFFYQDGVYNSNALNCPASDEVNLQQMWLTFSQDNQTAMINCVSAALRRGVLSEQDALENGKAHWNSHDVFVMGGLGELVSGIEHAERLVCF